MASSPAEQMSTILTPAVHFFMTSANTPVPVGGTRYTLCYMVEQNHARDARTVGNVCGGFVLCDDV